MRVLKKPTVAVVITAIAAGLGIGASQILTSEVSIERSLQCVEERCLNAPYPRWCAERNGEQCVRISQLNQCIEAAKERCNDRDNRVEAFGECDKEMVDCVNGQDVGCNSKRDKCRKEAKRLSEDRYSACATRAFKQCSDEADIIYRLILKEFE